MLSSTEKLVILSGSIIGSIYIFSCSLNSLNNIILRKNYYNETLPNKYDLNRLIAVNGTTMLFSAATFSYFAYIATK
jgi:hypothetical protein